MTIQIVFRHFFYMGIYSDDCIKARAKARNTSHCFMFALKLLIDGLYELTKTRLNLEVKNDSS